MLVLLSGWPEGLGLGQDVTPPGGGVYISLSTLLVLGPHGWGFDQTFWLGGPGSDFDVGPDGVLKL